MRRRVCFLLFFLLGSIFVLSGCLDHNPSLGLSLSQLKLSGGSIDYLRLYNGSDVDFYIESIWVSLYDKDGSFLEDKKLKIYDEVVKAGNAFWYYFINFEHSFSHPSTVKKVKLSIDGRFTDDDYNKLYYISVTLPESSVTLNGEVQRYRDHNSYRLAGELINNGETIITRITIRAKIFSDSNKQELVFDTGVRELSVARIKPGEVKAFDISTSNHYPGYYELIIDWDDRIELDASNLQVEYR